MSKITQVLFGGPEVHGHRTLSPVKLGISFILIGLLLFVGLFSKDRISTALMSGETIQINFAENYKLRKYVSEVKVAFVPVGKVSDVEKSEDGSAIVSVKVDDEMVDRLGSAPKAVIRPTTLLGGTYFVDLVPGGDPGSFKGDNIPRDRTELPVELDHVARALQPEALRGLQSTVGNVDGTLDSDGQQALQRLMADAPAALGPATGVLDAARGTRPDTDIPRAVTGLESTARVLTENEGQLDSIVTDLKTTSSVIGGRSDELATALGELPQTLRSTDAGLRRLDGTLADLRAVSAPARPVAQELDNTLAKLDPVLVEARPLVGDLRQLLVDGRPVVEGLVPASETTQGVLDDVRGPVLDRVNGPVRDWLYTPYHGTGPYDMTQTEKSMYQEIGYTFTNLDRAASMSDRNGHGVGFQPGVGSGSVGGMPVSIEQMFKIITDRFYFKQPVETLPPVDGPLAPRPGQSAPLTPGAPAQGGDR